MVVHLAIVVRLTICRTHPWSLLATSIEETHGQADKGDRWENWNVALVSFALRLPQPVLRSEEPPSLYRDLVGHIERVAPGISSARSASRKSRENAGGNLVPQDLVSPFLMKDDGNRCVNTQISAMLHAVMEVDDVFSLPRWSSCALYLDAVPSICVPTPAASVNLELEDGRCSTSRHRGECGTVLESEGDEWS